VSKVTSKAEARKRAFAARKDAQNPADEARACGHLMDHLKTLNAPASIAAYMAIRTEISPMETMKALHAAGHIISVPVIREAGQALVFSRWTPGAEMTNGPFGASVPATEDLVTPEILITPLVAFDALGYRLGYGGGFYDRTFQMLRAKRPTLGIGFAYGAQRMDCLPIEPTDQPLDAVVTENGVLNF